jgi:hypothetical protein
VLGKAIVDFFNISVPGIRVAGGLIISTVGFRMLFPAPPAVGAGRRRPSRTSPSLRSRCRASRAPARSPSCSARRRRSEHPARRLAADLRRGGAGNVRDAGDLVPRAARGEPVRPLLGRAGSMR